MNVKDKRILYGMLDFAQRISKRINGVSYDDFICNIDLQDAVLYAFGQLGEKTSTLSDEFKENYPNDKWYGLIGLRNRLFHSYEDINLQTIYKIAINDINGVIELILNIINLH